jgi:hypothetical protein
MGVTCADQMKFREEFGARALAVIKLGDAADPNWLNEFINEKLNVICSTENLNGRKVMGTIRFPEEFTIGVKELITGFIGIMLSDNYFKSKSVYNNGARAVLDSTLNFEERGEIAVDAIQYTLEQIQACIATATHRGVITADATSQAKKELKEILENIKTNELQTLRVEVKRNGQASTMFDGISKADIEAVEQQLGEITDSIQKAISAKAVSTTGDEGGPAARSDEGGSAARSDEAGSAVVVAASLQRPRLSAAVAAGVAVYKVSSKPGEQAESGEQAKTKVNVTVTTNIRL